MKIEVGCLLVVRTSICHEFSSRSHLGMTQVKMYYHSKGVLKVKIMAGACNQAEFYYCCCI